MRTQPEGARPIGGAPIGGPPIGGPPIEGPPIERPRVARRFEALRRPALLGVGLLGLLLLGLVLLGLLLLDPGLLALGPATSLPPAPAGPVERPAPAPSAPTHLGGPALAGRAAPGPTGTDVPASEGSGAEGAAPAAVRARVLDQHGAPVVAALVVALALPPDAPVATDASLPSALRHEADRRSDGEGRVTFHGLPPGAVLAVQEEEPPTHSGSAQRPAAGGAEVDLRVFRGCRLRGHVLDPSGRPCAGVRVTALALPEPGARYVEPVSALTDEQGAFGLALPPAAVGWPHPDRLEPGSVDLVVAPLEPHLRADAALAGWEGEVLPDQQDLRLTLSAPVWIEGTVVDGAGTPHAGWLRAERPGADPDEVYVTAATDAQGRFRLGPLRPGPWRVRAEPGGEGGASPVLRPSEPVEVQAPATGLRVVCPAGLVLRGQVEGSVRAGLVVEWHAPEGPFGPEVREGAPTDDAGRFVVPGLAPGRGRLLVRWEGEAAEDEPLCACWEGEPPASDLRLVLQPGRAIRGRVTGPPGRDRRVLAHHGTFGVAARVAEDGTFALRGLCPGLWRLRLAPRLGRAERVLSLRERAEGGLPVEAGAQDVVLEDR